MTTVNHQLSTINYQSIASEDARTTYNYQLSTINSQLSTLPSSFCYNLDAKA
ncbi:MAG: hypothetical protein ACRC62_11380 [Microcoleus sp.]